MARGVPRVGAARHDCLVERSGLSERAEMVGKTIAAFKLPIMDALIQILTFLFGQFVGISVLLLFICVLFVPLAVY